MASSLNLAVREAVPASLVLERDSPIALAKALKNEQELQVRTFLLFPPSLSCPLFLARSPVVQVSLSPSVSPLTSCILHLFLKGLSHAVFGGTATARVELSRPYDQTRPANGN